MRAGEVLALGGGVYAYFSDRRNGDLHRARGGQNRERLRRSLGLESLRGMVQVHGNRVAWLDEGGEPQADCLLGNAARVGAVAVGADCLVAALAGGRYFGVLHLGWRSLAAGLLPAAFSALKRAGDMGPYTLLLGPGAGPCCYEVGPEVAGALGLPERRGKVDLYRLAFGQARNCGARRVEALGVCTICNPTYFSHRREGSAAGRQGVVAWRAR